MKDLRSTIKLNNGVEMPWVGLGVFRAQEGGDVKEIITTALDAGYRALIRHLSMTMKRVLVKD